MAHGPPFADPDAGTEPEWRQGWGVREWGGGGGGEGMGHTRSLSLSAAAPPTGQRAVLSPHKWPNLMLNLSYGLCGVTSVFHGEFLEGSLITIASCLDADGMGFSLCLCGQSLMLQI